MSAGTNRGHKCGCRKDGHVGAQERAEDLVRSAVLLSRHVFGETRALWPDERTPIRQE